MASWLRRGWGRGWDGDGCGYGVWSSLVMGMGLRPGLGEERGQGQALSARWLGSELGAPTEARG